MKRMGNQPAGPIETTPRDAGGLLARFWERTIARPLRSIEQETRDFQASDAARGPDWKVMTVLVTVAVCLTLQRYTVGAGGPDRVAGWLVAVGLDDLAARFTQAVFFAEDASLNSLTYWSFGCVITYFVIPALVIRLGFRERLRDYGVKLRGAFTDLWIYGVMLAIVLPLVALVSADAHFQATYPFYRLAPDQPLWPRFWRWELEYAVQFFALEFFFRGFMLHGTRRRFGVYAIFVMMVPYCMIHYGKPMPEAFASIVAGIALGFMSLKNRSIWLGAAIHVAVALSMDFTSLWRQGHFY
jgi:membrane protease YdiL (CAAX protease family)